MNFKKKGGQKFDFFRRFELLSARTYVLIPGKSQQNEDSDDLHQQTNIEDSEDDCSGISETKISYLLKTLNPESFLDSTLGTDNQPQVPTTSQSEMV